MVEKRGLSPGVLTCNLPKPNLKSSSQAVEEEGGLRHNVGIFKYWKHEEKEENKQKKPEI